MSKTKKRKSIIRILFFQISLVILLFNIGLAFMNVQETIKIQKESDKALRDRIREEIIGLSEFQSSSLETFEKSFRLLQEDALSRLIQKSPRIDFSTVDLNKQLKLLGLDSTFNDLYVFDGYTIVNTTYMPDLGLDFAVFGEEHTSLLDRLRETRSFHADRFVFESSTKRLRSYAYQATRDGKYIIEIGSYSDMADKIMELFENRLRITAYENEDIASVNYWWGNEHYQYPLIDEALNRYMRDIKASVFSNRADTSTIFSARGQELNVEFMYVKQEPGSRVEDFAVSIVTDITNKNAPIYRIITRHAIQTVGFLLLVLFLIFLATRNLKVIILEFLKKTSAISKGALNERVLEKGNNEFTTLAEHFNKMVGKLETSYHELEDQRDEIVAQRDEIEAQRDEIEAQRDMVMEQKDQIEKINEELTDSIHYAEHIQSAILPREDVLNKLIPEHFILFRPRDIVSGDFFWITEVEGKVVFVVADCTGHGVPGAFMSMLGAAFLNEIVNKEYITHPSVILRRLRKEIINAMQQKGESGEHRDGMDIALCSIDFIENTVQFAGANNPLYIIRDKSKPNVVDEASLDLDSFNLFEIKGDKMPIGFHEKMDKFITHEIDLLQGDCLYMFSDGFADQFGGPKGKKFKYKPFKQLLLEHCELPMSEQKRIVGDTLEKWKDDYYQVDDIIVSGFRVL